MDTPAPSLSHIANAELTALDGSERKLLGSDIWKEKGAIIMIEATLLSSLKPELDDLGVQLVGIVHETLGNEEFKDYFKGPLYLDKERTFYGPTLRWMGLSAFFRIGVWRNFIQAKRHGVSGNMEGEGRILGGLAAVSKEKGIVYFYAEKEFGDHADKEDVQEAARKIAAKKD
eukprot:gene12863-14188_t